MTALCFSIPSSCIRGTLSFCLWLGASGLLVPARAEEAPPIKDVGPPVEREEKKEENKKEPSFSKEVQKLDLEKLLPTPLKLKVVKDAVVFADSNAERRLGVIPKGTVVTVITLGDKAFRVRGKALHDKISGWIGRSSLQPLDEKFVSSINKMIERARQVAELISKKEIALGMTSEEVVQSIGRPNAKRTRTDKTGASEILEYITYRSVPHQTWQRDSTGRMVQTTVWVKEEAGRLSVELVNDVVTVIEDSKNAAPRGPNVIPGPIVIDMLQ